MLSRNGGDSDYPQPIPSYCSCIIYFDEDIVELGPLSSGPLLQLIFPQQIPGYASSHCGELRSTTEPVPA